MYISLTINLAAGYLAAPLDASCFLPKNTQRARANDGGDFMVTVFSNLPEVTQNLLDNGPALPIDRKKAADSACRGQIPDFSP